MKSIKRPVGVVRFRVSRWGRLLYAAQYENLFVSAGLPALAALLGGDTAGEFASAIGFGSGAVAPTTGDTALTPPVYYKTIDSHTRDGLGSVTFNWSLTASAVISNTWAATKALALNVTIAPGNGYYYKVTIAGTTGASEPVFGTVIGGTTADGTVTWTNEGVYDSGAIGINIQELGLFGNTGNVALPGTVAPAPLLARRVTSQITFAAGFSESGSWTLTF